MTLAVNHNSVASNFDFPSLKVRVPKAWPLDVHSQSPFSRPFKPIHQIIYYMADWPHRTRVSFCRMISVALHLPERGTLTANLCGALYKVVDGIDMALRVLEGWGAIRTRTQTIKTFRRAA